VQLDWIYHWGVLSVFGIAAFAFPLLFLITVPYGGRHTSERWGPTVPSRLAWFLMEIPAPVCFLWAWSLGENAGEPFSLLFLTAFEAHYIHRAILYPLQMRSTGKRTPLLSAVLALSVNIANGWINGLAVSHIASYGMDWLSDPRFLGGAVLFVGGAWVNRHSDAILRGLRKDGGTGYEIPRGGLYEWVASPNYLGEIIQWIGWACATWTTAGAAFACLTIANLAPRAQSHRQWYRDEFPDYPPERKALVPRVW
jgi:protein-S-isoprenylcysteine O-methyltransferase Ste14